MSNRQQQPRFALLLAALRPAAASAAELTLADAGQPGSNRMTVRVVAGDRFGGIFRGMFLFEKVL